jgi:hypothetical protein
MKLKHIGFAAMSAAVLVFGVARSMADWDDEESERVEQARVLPSRRSR